MLARKLGEIGSLLYRALIFPFVRIKIEVSSKSIMKQGTYINKGTILRGRNFIGKNTCLTNTDLGFAPCTAQAAIEILDYYSIDVTGKNIVVIGRSLVVGKPLAVMLTNRNATVTICHSKTKDGT